MADTRVARRYAQALFQIALKQGIVRGVEDDLGAFVEARRTGTSVKAFLQSPTVAREAKIKVLDEKFSDQMTALGLNAIKLMVSKGREDKLDQIYDAFVVIRRNYDGIIYAAITSAEVLPIDQKDAIVQKISQILGKTVEAEFHVDPSQIGGVKVAYDNYVLDGTVRGTLSKLREKLRYELLKQL
jgi:F-type H+-transporting ATPase subunit delta